MEIFTDDLIEINNDNSFNNNNYNIGNLSSIHKKKGKQIILKRIIKKLKILKNRNRLQKKMMMEMKMISKKYKKIITQRINQMLTLIITM